MAAAEGLAESPYQFYGDNYIIAVLPWGQVDFLERDALELLRRPIEEQMAHRAELAEMVVKDPIVDLDRFRLEAPVIAFVEVTNACNLRCKHCYVSSAMKRPNEMSTEEVLRLIDDLAELGTLQIFLTGGELFMRRDIVQIIRHARAKPFVTQIFTNGTLLTEDKLAALPPGTSFNISFDTADPSRTIRGKMDYPKLRAAFDAMSRYGHVYRTALSVHTQNIQDTVETFQWCADNGFPRPQWAETNPLGRAMLHPDLFLQPHQIDEVFDAYRRCMDLFTAPPDEFSADMGAGNGSGAQGMHIVDTIKFCVRLEEATGMEKCARSVVYVNASGDVYPCSNCQSAELYKAGNVRQTSLRQIWAQGFDEFRRITYSDFAGCRSCRVFQAGVSCQFRCPPLSRNMGNGMTGCGATEYLKEFMVRAHDYWEQRRESGIKTLLFADPKRP
jgi:AdoMet-dependent heme synthase